MKRSLILVSAALLPISFGRTQMPLAAQPQGGRGAAQGGRGGAPPAGIRKHILVFGMTKGFHHDSVSNGMASVSKMGRDTGAWDSEISTDPAIIRAAEKPVGEFTPLNLANFDAIVLASTTGEIPLEDQQKKDLLAFVHDEGKGLVAIHAALDSNYKSPEYVEMIGGWFDGHPWNTFRAPVIMEDSTFSATRHFAKSFRIRDEIYQPKQWSRDKVNVLMRLDESKLDLTRQHLREDHDWAIAWSKLYGKGRVFYSTLGHTNEAWDDPDVIKMYSEAIKWVLGRTDGSVAPHPHS